MKYQKITGQVSATDVQAIKAAITTIEQKLPFLITLNEMERKGLRKTGDGRLAFVQNAAVAAQDNPQILPQTFSTGDFTGAVGLFSTMSEINTLAAQLASKIDDTHLSLGAQALDGASDVYGYVKTAAKKTPGLKPVADQMGQQFQKAVATRRAKKNANATAVIAK